MQLTTDHSIWLNIITDHNFGMSFREHALERQLGVSLTDNWNSSFLPALAGIINCYLNIKNITNTNTFFF